VRTKDLNEDWDEQREKLKHEFPFLTEGDLYFIQGKKETMLEKLRIMLGKSKIEMLKIISLL
jgi:hypothetical protein